MERFLIGGIGLVSLTWEEAYLGPIGRSIKTSLALTRARARRAMELSLRRDALADLYMRGLVRFF